MWVECKLFAPIYLVWSELIIPINNSREMKIMFSNCLVICASDTDGKKCSSAERNFLNSLRKSENPRYYLPMTEN